MQNQESKREANEMLVVELNYNEAKLLSLIRTGVYQSINVRIKENQVFSLDLIQIHEPNRRLIDLLRENPYQNLTVKTHKGKISHIEQTTKMKFN